MSLTKPKVKKEPFRIYPIADWSMTKYGVEIFVNSTLHKPSDGWSCDVEDDGQGKFVGIGFSDGFKCLWFTDLSLVKEIPRCIFHNGISDIFKLKEWGYKVNDTHILWDTQTIAHYLDSSRKRFGLKDLVKEDLGISYPSYKDLIKKGSEYTNLKALSEKDPDLVCEYNCGDTYTTRKLAEKQGFNGKDEAPAYYTSFERPASVVFQKMEQKGIRVDLAYLKDLKASLEASLEAAKAPLINELGTINLDSPKQLLAALNAKGITPILKGKPSTDKRALEKYRGQYKIIDLLFSYSEISTLLSNFVYPYLERNEEEVHPQYRQTGTRTGRPSCSNPNLLQIPRRTENGKRVRRMFIPREGNLFGDLDFGQIEPRVLAHLSEDSVLSQMFNDGVDFHTFTAERLNINRDRAKILNLSVGYRATYKSVSQQLKCSWDQAQKEIDKWWSLFPSLYDWQQSIIYQARKDGYCTTLMGRRIKVDNLNTNNPFQKEGAERQLINNITQGSAAEIMKMAMIKVDKANIDIICQIYDELLIEEVEDGIQEAVNKSIDIMQGAVSINVPLVVEAGIGNNWSECKS